MNVLFLTLSKVVNIGDRGIYTDLLVKFCGEGNNVYIVSPIERRERNSTYLKESQFVHILRVKTPNIVGNVSFIEKGFSYLLLPVLYYKACLKFFKLVKFDIIVYATPPISWSWLISKIKKKNKGVLTYLLLKDILPQGAVDLQKISKDGIAYKILRRQEKKLYSVSDFIGCMSPENVNYILSHNNYLSKNVVEVNPNSIRPSDKCVYDKMSIRAKYGLPGDKIIFVYGGNLGKPQGLDFMLKCLKENINRKDVFFLVVGSGSEFINVESWFLREKPGNALLMNYLKKNEYDELLGACDVGLVFLSNMLTVPAFPSRLLSYMECKLPILLAVNKGTDVGRIVQNNGFGFYCESGDLESFNNSINFFLSRGDRKNMGENAYKYLIKNYTVDVSYATIVSHMIGKNS